MKEWHRTTVLSGNTNPLSGANDQVLTTLQFSVCRCSIRFQEDFAMEFLSGSIDVPGTQSQENDHKYSAGNIYPDSRSF